MKTIRTERRTKKIKSVLLTRQDSLKIVLENIYDPHNVSAIFRTCDAAGIPKVTLLYYTEPFPKIGKKSSASAFKWVEKEKFKSVEKCYETLKEKGFKIYASHISDDAKNLYDLDLTEKVAIVLGNEHRGISEEAAKLADERFLIPMYGMVQSLNVSVSAAITIYEALRQRREKGMYNSDKISLEVLEEKINNWSKK
ncbi:RNA methyltransferase [bacterium BMS3Abin03]|nr:RNA methyltransferase [bacterium BMS3Abin03]MCG6960533.1 RNA methyltransferase [bacterium BMS3Abin03]